MVFFSVVVIVVFFFFCVCFFFTRSHGLSPTLWVAKLGSQMGGVAMTWMGVAIVAEWVG